MVSRTLSLAALGIATLLLSCKAPDKVVVTASASPGTVVDGGTSTISSTLTVNNQPAASHTVDFAVSGCGSLSKKSVTTDGPVAAMPGTVPDVTFTGTLPAGSEDTTCKATITVTSGTGTTTCDVTVTPKPRVLDIPGTGATPAPTVSITPEVSSTNPFKATYKIETDSGWPLMIVNITLQKTSDVSSAATTITPTLGKGVTIAVASKYAANTTADTITVNSDAKAGGTADFDVRVGVAGNWKAVDFSAAALAKLKPAPRALPGPKP
jgi:hypothetical protein